MLLKPEKTRILPENLSSHELSRLGGCVLGLVIWEALADKGRWTGTRFVLSIRISRQIRKGSLWGRPVLSLRILFREVVAGTTNQSHVLRSKPFNQVTTAHCRRL